MKAKGLFARVVLGSLSVSLLHAKDQTTGVQSAPNVVVQWNNAALQGVRDSKLGPPMVARALFVIHNCIYDAWAAYDKKAIGTVFRGSLRQSKADRTLANKNKA